MKKRFVGVLTVCALLFSACSNEKDYYTLIKLWS